MTTERNPSIDIAKGIAIVAIVLGHVLRGLGGAGILDGSAAGAAQADRFLYLWHLAVFAFLSALFVGRAVDRRSAGAYLRVRLTTLAYLYLVWSLIQGLAKVVTGSLVNTPSSLADVMRIWVPEGQLWFLPWLMLMTVVAALTGPWRAPNRAVAVIAVGAVVSLAFWGLNGPVAFTQGLGLTAFFVAGAAWGSSRFLTALLARTTPRLLLGTLGAIALAGLALGTAAVPPTTGGAGRDALSVALGVLASIAGLITVLTGACGLSRVPLIGPGLAFLGRRSLEIFLAHILAAAGLRIVLVQLGITEPVVHILVGTLGGVVLPLVLRRVLGVVHVPWLFAPPAVVLGRATTAEPRRRQAITSPA